MPRKYTLNEGFFEGIDSDCGQHIARKLIEEIYGDANVALERKQRRAEQCLSTPMALGGEPT